MPVGQPKPQVHLQEGEALEPDVHRRRWRKEETAGRPLGGMRQVQCLLCALPPGAEKGEKVTEVNFARDLRRNRGFLRGTPLLQGPT